MSATPQSGGFDLFNFAKGLFGQGSNAPAEQRAQYQSELDRVIGKYYNSPNRDPGEFFKGLAEYGAKAQKLDQDNAKFRAGLAVESGRATLPIYGERKTIDTDNQIKLNSANTNQDLQRIEGLTKAQGGILGQTISGEQAAQRSQNEIIGMALNTQRDMNRDTLAYNERVLAANKGSGLERLLGNLLPAAATVASFFV